MRSLYAAIALGAFAIIATAAYAAGIPAFPTPQEAQQHCPQDVVVYGENKSGGVYHLPGSRFYGHLKNGMFMCKAEADAGGWHAAANNQ